MLDAIQEKVPKGDSKRDLEKANRIRNIYMARSNSKSEVEKKICSVFNVKDFTVLELNVLDAIQRRGCLYLAKLYMCI